MKTVLTAKYYENAFQDALKEYEHGKTEFATRLAVLCGTVQSIAHNAIADLQTLEDRIEELEAELEGQRERKDDDARGD